jgi:hypothetical protein
VAAPPAGRTGLLVIRAWIEGYGESRLRARITRVTDLSKTEEVSTVATREEIAGAVADWLDEFLGNGSVTER